MIRQIDPTDIAKQIRMLRGQLVILDVDLADLYGVAPERLIELVKRDQPKFSVEFAFSLEPDELRNLEPRVASLAFTEHGVIIAASVLNSPQAVEMSIHVVRAFVKLREALPSDRELVRKDEALDFPTSSCNIAASLGPPLPSSFTAISATRTSSSTS